MRRRSPRSWLAAWPVVGLAGLLVAPAPAQEQVTPPAQEQAAAPAWEQASAPPAAQSPAPTVAVPEVTPLPDVVVSAPEPRYVAPTTRDRIGRIWAPVLINGEGPFRLVLDTGASRSAITQRVVDRLRLPVHVDSVRLRGVTGTGVASSIRAETLEVGDLLVEGSTMPIVADAFGGAEGVLGAEGLADKRIAIEFRKDRIDIRRSRSQKPSPGFMAVPFKFSQNRGMRVDVRVGPVKAVGLIDTGSQVTVGNLALREALSRRRGANGEMEDAIIGVTQDIQQATRIRIPSIVAGDLLVRNAEILFSDLYIFDHWKLSSKPALLIGMDVLGVLDTLIIDYRRSELQVRTGR
jgi:predicted aspartyl protease